MEPENEKVTPRDAGLLDTNRCVCGTVGLEIGGRNIDPIFLILCTLKKGFLIIRNSHISS